MYAPLKIKVGQSGAYSKSMTYDEPFCTKDEYALVIKHVPFTIRPAAKIPVKQTWKDQDGEDVYLAPDTKYEAYDWECTFVYLSSYSSVEGKGANECISEFVKRISGKWLKIHDSYTNTTRSGVYVKEFDPEPRFLRRQVRIIEQGEELIEDRDLVIFKVTFRVNNPEFEEKF